MENIEKADKIIEPVAQSVDRIDMKTLDSRHCKPVKAWQSSVLSLPALRCATRQSRKYKLNKKIDCFVTSFLAMTRKEKSVEKLRHCEPVRAWQSISILNSENSKIVIKEITGWHRHFVPHNDEIFHAPPPVSRKKIAFTLAEILITIAIIGVVAVMLLNTVRKIQDIQYKNAYKKAYADINQAFREPIANGELSRTQLREQNAANEEFDILKKNLKVTKECESKDLYECWNKDGIGVCTGSCSGSSDKMEAHHIGKPQNNQSPSFIDASGRAWVRLWGDQNYIAVDTNGFKKPNKFGKDRFIFTFVNRNYTRVNDASQYLILHPARGDYLNKSDWCANPPCYYSSWLK